MAENSARTTPSGMGRGCRRPAVPSLLSYDARGNQVDIPMGFPSARNGQHQDHSNALPADIQAQGSSRRNKSRAGSVTGSRRSSVSSTSRRRQLEVQTEAKACEARQQKDREIEGVEAEIAELKVKLDIAGSDAEKTVLAGTLTIVEVRLEHLLKQRDAEQKRIFEKASIQQRQIDIDEEDDQNLDGEDVDDDHEQEESGEIVGSWFQQNQAFVPPVEPVADSLRPPSPPPLVQPLTIPTENSQLGAPRAPIQTQSSPLFHQPAQFQPSQSRVSRAPVESYHYQVPPRQTHTATRPPQFQQTRSQPLNRQQATTSAPQGSVGLTDLVEALRYLKTEDGTAVKHGVDKELPKFGGEPEQWVQFVTEYNRTTSKYKIDNSENLSRLRRALVGNAKSTVQHLMANVANVPVIIDTLQKRFGKPRVVLNALAEKARTCQQVTITKPSTMIEFGIAVQALYANVVSFGEDGYLKSVDLMDSLVRKLAPDLAVKWLEWLVNTGKTDGLEEFQEWIALQLDIAYQRDELKPVDTDEKLDKNRKRGPGRVHVAVGEKCFGCEKPGHFLDKCDAFVKNSLQDRWELVKKHKLCISCLHPGHVSKECSKRQPCAITGCTRIHHKLLHTKGKKQAAREPRVADSAPQRVPELVAEDQGRVAMIPGNIGVVKGCDGPLAIIPVKVRSPTGEVVRCHVMLDSGASRTLIRRDLAEKLHLKGPEIMYSYAGITGELVTEKSMKVDCEVSGLIRNSKYHNLTGAMVLEDIKMTPYSFDVHKAKRRWPHLKNVAASSVVNVKPDIIVGNNNPHLILARKLVSAGELDPIGWRTLLGWTISGNFDDASHGSINLSFGRSSIGNDELHQLIKESFSLEDFGVKLPKPKGRNLDDKRAYKIMDETTRKVKDKWETGLLWREDDVNFPESESAAFRRLLYTENKMKDPEYAKMYQEKFEEYISKGYMRKMTPAEVAKKSGKRYVIPHFGVTNPNKSGKFRLVMDAKAKSNGVSLNDMLLSGPALIRSLVGILWNFRRHRIGLSGDIKDMFLRIMITPDDRDAQLLLWRDGDKTRPVEYYQMESMIFGATCSPASAIFVKDANARTFQKELKHAVEVIVNDMFMDDVVTGGQTEEEVIQLRKEVTDINASGNFEVCKWLSSSAEVIRSIPVELRAEDAKMFEDKGELPSQRVLGLWWTPEEDVFQFRLGMHQVKPKILDGEVPTKREMCGVVMSVYDPIGFVSHYKIKGLILLQEVWRLGVGWDDEIPMEVQDKWTFWLRRLSDIKEVKLPRCYSVHLYEADSLQLHTFVDASSEAFSAVCYLRVQKDEKLDISFVAAKARVAPLKKATIPRLELQAALMGTRLAEAFEEETKLKISSRYFWSDSSTVLNWLNSRAGKLPEFVANRVGEIQEISNRSDWHWISTKINVADIATRFDIEVSFSPESIWFQGPEFLRDNESTWNFEMKRKNSEVGSVNVVTAVEPDVCEVGEKLSVISDVVPEPERFSRYNRLLRATSGVWKAMRYWRARQQKVPSVVAPWSELEPERDAKGKMKRKFVSNLNKVDLKLGELLLYRLAQEDAYAIDLTAVRKTGELNRRGNLWKLKPMFGQDGLFRIDGRIGKAKAPATMKFPVILPPRHHITELLVLEKHCDFAHQGLDAVQNSLREKVWIVDSGHVVKRAFVNCSLCKVRKAKPVPAKMANLPACRLESFKPAFTYTGVDLFGPMEVTVQRHREKRWGVLFCCMTSRAVHLEIVNGLSTDEFMMALSRFVDIRRRPEGIYSDNGTNFVGAARELRECWKKINMAKIQENSKFQEIDWNFNPPGAPHMGGAWERLIQTVKRCLSGVLHEKHPKDKTLETVFRSVENMLNSRPLTSVSCDPADEEAITPNHLLKGFCDVGPAIPADIDPQELVREQWKRSQILADQFWQRWTTAYLPKLLRRGKWNEPADPIREGAIVFYPDENPLRNRWVRGVVTKIFPSEDGQVRQVEVTSPSFKSKVVKVSKRPVTKLCPIGVEMGNQQPCSS